MIDGTAVPGWAPQHGPGRRAMPKNLKGDAKAVWEERELARQLRVEGRLRQYARDFGFGFLRNRGRGKDKEPEDISSADVRSGTVKAWRGLYHVALVEQATGLAAVWLTFDATYDEAAALMPLLSRLFELWPELDEIDDKQLAADAAWDEDQFVRTCELDYGVHAIFRWHREHGEDKPSRRHQLPNGATKNGQITEYDSHGHLICPVHNTRMNFQRWNAASRKGLEPGESSDERIHAECLERPRPGEQPCGVRTLQIRHGWRELTCFPHYSDGVPGRYFTRTAMLARLNQIESVWNALKSAGLATPGAARRRISHGVTYDALLSLMHLMRACLVLADQRQHNGLAPYGGLNAPRTAHIPTRNRNHHKPRRAQPTRVIAHPQTRDPAADLIRSRGRPIIPGRSSPSWAP